MRSVLSSDYFYFPILALVTFGWLVSVVLYIDKKLRERRWRKRDEARPGYIDWTTLASYSEDVRLP